MAQEVIRAGQDAAAAAKPPAKAYRISKKLDMTLERIAEGHKIADACKISGYDPSSYHLAIKKPHVQERLDQLIQRVIRRRGPEALKRIEKLADSAKSEYVALEANKDLANRAGYLPPKTEQGSGGTVLNVQINLG